MDSIETLLAQARYYTPQIGVRCNRLFGAVYIGEHMLFSTEGSASESVIAAYLAGFILSQQISKVKSGMR